MLAWLKHRLAKRQAQQRLKRHFKAAQSSPIQQSSVAAAMVAIENEMVEHEQKQMEEGQRLIFMMTYECFVMWALKRGIESVLSPQETEDAIVAMRDYFAKHAWYEPGSFEKIWDAIQRTMPSSLTPKGTFNTIYPLADMTFAAQAAGFALSPPFDYLFGVHVIQSIGNLGVLGRQIAEEHLALTKRNVH